MYKIYSVHKYCPSSIKINVKNKIIRWIAHDIIWLIQSHKHKRRIVDQIYTSLEMLCFRNSESTKSNHYPIYVIASTFENLQRSKWYIDVGNHLIVTGTNVDLEINYSYNRLPKPHCKNIYFAILTYTLYF